MARINSTLDHAIAAGILWFKKPRHIVGMIMATEQRAMVLIAYLSGSHMGTNFDFDLGLFQIQQQSLLYFRNSFWSVVAEIQHNLHRCGAEFADFSFFAGFWQLFTV